MIIDTVACMKAYITMEPTNLKPVFLNHLLHQEVGEVANFF
jgi:hypothetical protein